MRIRYALTIVLRILAFLLLWVPSAALLAQVSIKLGPNAIAANEAYTITASATNARLTACSEFPDIEGLTKAGVSRSMSTNIVNGQMTTLEMVIQQYIPAKKGKIRIPSFTMTINGQTVKSPGGTVEVGDAVQRQASVFDPFGGMWGGYGAGGHAPPSNSYRVDDAPKGAFLSVSTDKKEVYVGEGFNITVSFLKPFEERNRYAFDVSIGDQVVAIQKALKPAGCWEENTPITRLQEERVVVNGKLYISYKLYQATFFPFSAGKIEFPSVSLDMKTYTATGRRTIFGNQMQEAIQTFKSTVRTLKVKDLPPHPLKDKVNVGVYELAEDVEGAADFRTGQHFTYSFAVRGQGNISSVAEPQITPTDSLNIYLPPNTRQQVNKNNSAVYGTKQFDYFIEPLEPGLYRLEDHFHWIFFNLETERYDTLSPKFSFRAVGESKRDRRIADADLGDYYRDLDRLPNAPRPLSGHSAAWWAANAGLALALAGLGVLLWKSR